MAYAYTHNDPFSDSSNGTREMQAALRDVVTIDGQQRKGISRSSTNNSNLDAYGQDDILGAYGDEQESSRSRSNSPVKSRTAQPPSSSSAQQQSSRPSGQARTKSYGDSKSKSRSGGGSSSAAAAAKAKQDLDVIDRLDISGLYGGGGFTRHDGPYAAATASRNKGPRAPMAAFDPSALAPPTAQAASSTNGRPSNPPRGSSKGVSARAQAAMAAMNDHEHENGLGGPDGLGHPGLGRRLSDSSVTMGFPTKGSGKGAQLIEMYGVRDAEAWEDYGRRQYGGGSGDNSGTSSRESVVPAGVSKEDRIERAQSIWDIEATLAAGKPVGQAPPPPMPVMPSTLSSSAIYGAPPPSDNKPKRSKSLAARLRGGRSGRKQERSDDGDDTTGMPAVPLHARDTNQREDDDEEAESKEQPSPLRANGAVRFENPRFAGGEGVKGTRSLGQEGQVESSSLGRRPSVMQRLFSTKRKN